ncbi:hypothetical protein QYE76_015356 [Lolium multiflorum]|uniref:PTBP1-like RNA recognition motif 2 domain-containing protein n=1 Tax=Lolium multiflorum TaxID=4521 RepID=A0AAD8X9S4_LOLMU|nr:hypothetical protein QYE76_015356 [Lolium multiflorum]
MPDELLAARVHPVEIMRKHGALSAQKAAYYWAGNVSRADARHVFDAMPSAREVGVQLFLGHVLSITVHYRTYPVTQKVFHQVFDAYGADEVYMTMRSDHAKVFVLFRSRHDAARAREALHGRNIYDGCCLMDITEVFAGYGARDEVYVNKATYVEALFTFGSSHAARRAREALHGRNIYDGCCRIEIQYVSLTLSNTTETSPTPTTANPTPCPASALKAVDPNEHGVALYASPLDHSVALVAEATSEECPVMAEQLGSNQELHRISAVSDDKEQVQVKDELPGALEVFEGTPEKIRSGAKLHRRVKWVSRTPTLHHPPDPLSVVGGDLCSSSSWESAPDVAEISSDEEDSPPVARDLCFDDQEDLSPVARNLQQKGMAGTIDNDGDDCVILDYDLHSTAAMKDKEGSVGDGGSDDELQIVAEKGEVACRDFPHSRHLCSNMPFGTTSHQKHCTMCYCFVCDAPSPCSYWGKALSVDDHCHATDKEIKWKTLRQAFRWKTLPASHPEKETVVYPVMMSLGCLSLGN